MGCGSPRLVIAHFYYGGSSALRHRLLSSDHLALSASTSSPRRRPTYHPISYYVLVPIYPASVDCLRLLEAGRRGPGRASRRRPSPHPPRLPTQGAERPSSPRGSFPIRSACPFFLSLTFIIISRTSLHSSPSLYLTGQWCLSSSTSNRTRLRNCNRSSRRRRSW